MGRESPKGTISAEMKNSYMDYAMSVIVSRALPDVRDGLKPVQRRILYAMYDQGLKPGTKFTKCAAIVGEVMKKYHPHGDQSIYDTLVRLAQPWVMRYPLIDSQGNFGSMDGDAAAPKIYGSQDGPCSCGTFERHRQTDRTVWRTTIPPSIWNP